MAVRSRFLRFFAWLLLVCLALSILPQHRATKPHAASLQNSLFVETTHSEDWRLLLEKDPIAALGLTLNQYKQTVRGFSATMIKQERINKTLYPVERISIAVREEPFAVCMIWKEGARNNAEGTLYVAGENAGSMKVWRPNALFGKLLSVGPMDLPARTSARYTITESSLYHGHYRTFMRWKEAQKTDTLDVKYLGLKAVPELKDKKCHHFKRVCKPGEVDAFSIHEPAKPNAAQEFEVVNIYLDPETGYQIGAELLRTDGERVGAYFFCDLVINPKFPAGQFTESIFKK
jgi:hypothetical protein